MLELCLTSSTLLFFLWYFKLAAFCLFQEFLSFIAIPLVVTITIKSEYVIPTFDISFKRQCWISYAPIPTTKISRITYGSSKEKPHLEARFSMSAVH